MTMRYALRACCAALLLASVTAQRGGCSADPMPCRFDSTTPEFSTNLAQTWPLKDSIEWSPSLPGAYTFAYEATDLCNEVSQNVTVHARCPPAPVARIETEGITPEGIVYQGGKATLKAQSSTASFASGSIVSYTWYVVQAPTASPLYTSVTSKTPVGTSSLYTTDSLQIDGQYKIRVVVSDGCSMDQAVICFSVQCGCGPTANAGATSTIWTNTPTAFNNGATSSGTNMVNLNTPTFILDGSLSYDFDTSSGLTYDWSFQEWVQILDDGNQRVWSPTTNMASTGRGGGLTYKTECSSNVGASTHRSKCSFMGIPSASAGSTAVGAISETDVSPTPKMVTTTPVGFPRKCPAYVATEYEFLTPTTQMHANIERTIVNTTTCTKYTQRTTQTLPADVVTTTYCEIQIQQVASGVPNARNNPVATLTVSGLKECRGLWTYRLVVTDGCGAATASTDEIKLTVRCNEPPVAVLCCNNTQMWSTQFQRFEQVRIDGRSSDDPDRNGAALTYTWSFIDSPEGFCGANGYAHQPCEESYCQDANGFTEISSSQGGSPFIKSYRGSPGVACGPTVFPVIRDQTLPLNQPCSQPSGGSPAQGTTVCTYTPIAPTGYHVGNSAYFTPSTKGTYQVKLAVSDGCSTTEDTVYIVAECPVLTATAAAVGRGGTGLYNLVKPGSGPATINLEGAAQYAADESVLSFSWKSSGGNAKNPLPAVVFSAPNAKAAVASFSAAGVYTVTFEVTDKCQTVTATVPPITVSCNAAPNNANLQAISGVTSGVNQVIFSGTSFPAVRLRAGAVDQDQLTYSYSMTTGTITGVQTGPEYEFTPIANNQGNFTYTIQATATDGCSTSTPGSISIRAECRGPLVARATISGGGGSRGSTSSTIEYDPTAPNNNVFPSVSIGSSETTWPYNDVPGNTKQYSWSVTTSSTSGATGVTFSGQSTNQISITPQMAAAYTATLTVSDGCQNQSATVSFETRCSTGAQAQISVTPGATVQWDSFKSATQGGFPLVTLNGSLSTGYTGMALTYGWGVAQGNTESVNLGNTIGAITSFTPAKGGNYGFTLEVSNGPCPKSAMQTVQIQATCNELNAVLKQGATSSSTISLSSQWDGSKFPTVELDGSDLTYRQSSGRGVGGQQSGNLRSLKFTWNMVKSPSCSCYGQESGPQVTTSVTNETPKSTAQVAQNNASLVISDETWQTCVISQTIATTTTLANHHYLLPHTCFKPDCAGLYEVTLTIDDGCLTRTATATVTASCGVPPSVAIDNSASGTLRLQGTKFTRINLLAIVTGSDMNQEVLTYAWELTKVPAGSKLVTNGYASITNGQMPSASFVPDRAGVYEFRFMADDGCNTPVYATSSMTVSCDSTLAIASATPQPVSISWEGNANAATGMNNFGNRKFTLNGRVDGTCNTLSTRWRLIARSCTDPYELGATPPPLQPTATCTRCALNCSWSVIDTPCTDPKVNADYTAHKLEELAGSTVQCKDKIRFTPQYPGTYTLQFSVQDCCGRHSDTMRVVAKCQTGIKANVGTSQITSIFKCMADGNEDWETHTLQGTPEADPNAPDPTSVASCPVTPTAPSCANAPTGCCPTSDCGCSYQCPQCPACAQCPQCPGYTSATSGSVAEYRLPYHTAFAQQASVMANDPLAKSSVLTGMIAPLGSMIVVSLMANVVMLVMTRSRKSVDLPH